MAGRTQSLVLDSIRDQHGSSHFRVGIGDGFTWISSRDLHANAASIYSRLERSGINLLTNSSKEAFRREIEGVTEFRVGLVASYPGWVGGAYAFADGTVAKPNDDDREVIVTFETDPRFQTSAHDLLAWKEDMAPLVAEQTLLMFAIGLALVGPLMRFAPPDFSNPIIEFVGQPEIGKSALGLLASSLWGGAEGSGIGCGETWDFSPRAIDGMKQQHADGLLFLDEANMEGATAAQRSAAQHDAIFRLAGTQQRRRFGDPPGMEHHRLAVLSTSNEPLSSLLGKAEAKAALRSRVVTLKLTDRPYGILDYVPAAYASSRSAVEAIQRASHSCFGVVSRAFVQKIAFQHARRPRWFECFILKSIEQSMERLADVRSERNRKALALPLVALHLAQRLNVVPTEWGDPIEIVQRVAQMIDDAGGASLSAKAAVLAYVDKHANELRRSDALPYPLSPEEFQRAAGFWLADGELFVPTTVFRRSFEHHEKVMRELRDSGFAKTERGSQPKLSIKVPRAVCGEGRGYCINTMLLQRMQKAPAAD